MTVHENPEDRSNSHWLLHVPPAFAPEFRATVRRFLKKVVDAAELGKALHFQVVGGPGTFAKYMLKGIVPTFGDYLHIKPEDQGFVPGRGRTSVCRTIGRSARKDAFWQRKRRPKA